MRSRQRRAVTRQASQHRTPASARRRLPAQSATPPLPRRRSGHGEGISSPASDAGSGRAPGSRHQDRRIPALRRCRNRQSHVRGSCASSKPVSAGAGSSRWSLALSRKLERGVRRSRPADLPQARPQARQLHDPELRGRRRRVGGLRAQLPTLGCCWLSRAVSCCLGPRAAPQVAPRASARRPARVRRHRRSVYHAGHSQAFDRVPHDALMPRRKVRP
jgi:hypothetical protein